MKRRYDGHGFKRETLSRSKKARECITAIEAKRKVDAPIPSSPTVSLEENQTDHDSEWGGEEPYSNNELMYDGYQFVADDKADKFVYTQDANTGDDTTNISQDFHKDIWDSDEWEQRVTPLLPITIQTAYTIIMWFIIAVNLSKSGIDKLLLLLQAFLPEDNALAKTRYKFEKLLGFQSNMTKYYYCGTCKLVTSTNKCKCSCKSKTGFLLWGNIVSEFIRRLGDPEYFRKACFYRTNRGDRPDIIFTFNPLPACFE